MSKRSFNFLDLFHSLILLLIAVYSFTPIAVEISWQFLAGIVLISLVYLALYLFRKKFILSINPLFLLWFVTFLILLLSLYSSNYASASIYFVGCYAAVLVIGIIVSLAAGAAKKFETILLVFSLIHVLMTVVSLFIPQTVLQIARAILNNEQYRVNVTWLSIGAHIGITGDASMDSFYITVFISIFFSRLLVDRSNRFFNSMMIVLGLFALILTTKRGAIVGDGIALLATSIIFYESKKRSRREKKRVVLQIFVILLAFIVVYEVVKTNPYLSGIFSRFSRLGDVTTGRIYYYKIVWEKIKNNPFLGMGINTTKNLLSGDDAHDIYLQILGELGLGGFIVFITAFFTSLVACAKRIKRYSTLETDDGQIMKTLLQSIFFQVFFLAYGVTGNPLYNGFIFIYYFCMVALVFSIAPKPARCETGSLPLARENLTIIMGPN